MSKYRIVKRTMGNSKVVYVVQTRTTVFPFIKVWSDERITDTLPTAKWVIACKVQEAHALKVIKEEVVE